MKGPYLRLLSGDELKRMHQASLRILEQTGMIVDHAEAREMLEGAGAKVCHDGKRVYFSPALVEASLAKVPRKLLHAGRNPQQDFVVEAGGELYSRTAGGAVNYVELRTGTYRRARLDDWREFARLADALPNIHSLGTLHCGDVPPATADIHSLHVLLACQRKNIVHNAFRFRNYEYMVEMMTALRGTAAAVRERPLVHHIISPVSPLYLPEDDTDQLLLAARSGIPTDVPVMPISGISAPITVAGTVALANAEFLGIMTLAQVAAPGHAMPYFLDPVSGDMRTGTPLMGAPEVALLNAVIAQLGSEFYGLPPEGIGLDSDSLISGQTMFQKGCNMVCQVMAGGKLIIGAGVIETCMAASPVQLVIDDEVVAIAKRLWRGVTVNDETLAVNTLDRVGPRGSFLTEEHTIKHLRSGELLALNVFDRDAHGTWEAKGKRDLETRAREKAVAILDKHQPEPLPADVIKELQRIVDKADQELAAT